MRIMLHDQSFVSELVRFLSERGCIAYVPGGGRTIEVIRTRSFGKQESDEIRKLASEWQTVSGAEGVLSFRD
jgi:hypothetical protein